MFQHLFVAERTPRLAQMLCEAASEPGDTQAGRVALECLRCIDPGELARLRASSRRSSAVPPSPTTLHSESDCHAPFLRSKTQRSPSPTLRGRTGFDSDADDSMTVRRRGRSSSLRRGERPGDVTNVRAAPRSEVGAGRSSLFDIEMPHRCGLKVFVVVDGSLFFACVGLAVATRDDALPLLRTVRREFLRSIRPESLILVRPEDCRPFGPILLSTLRDANRAVQRRLPERRDDWVEVWLNVYNILEEGTNSSLRFFGVGLHHTGVEIHGREWSYGGALPGMDRGDETGIFCIAPRTGMPASHFKESILLGHTRKGPSDIDRIIGLMIVEREWLATDYHILTKNCNDFCARLADRLGGWFLPPWVNRAAKVSAAVVPDAVLTRVLRHLQPPKQSQPLITEGSSSRRGSGTVGNCGQRTQGYSRKRRVSETALAPLMVVA
eukprot:Hpha_TRINITY_DN12019_c0_g1::TRINITY_DN12019_c0_g1_i1::g.141059::m.141059